MGFPSNNGKVFLFLIKQVRTFYYEGFYLKNKIVKKVTGALMKKTLLLRQMA
jgi:hypothetical protein